METYKKLLIEYKDKVIDNYEDWFAKSVLLDISEIGGFDTLIDDNYEFLFNVDVSNDLHNIINNLLNDEEISRGRLKEWEKILIQLIKLKRITDKRILENKAYDEEWINEYIFNIKNEKSKTTQNEQAFFPIILNLKITNSNYIISALHSFLEKERFIKDCSLNDFKIHFEEKKQPKSKIHWIEENEKLVELILLLNDKNILKPIRRNRDKPFTPIIIQHFKNKHNKEFNKNSISTAISKKLNDGFSSFSKELVDFFNLLKIEFN